ncbi:MULTISPECIES: helix-turn-helix domain-containing protein [Micrococcaceae]|jgi:transposase-like protein|uniref:Transposase-like protein n=1 Tax=Paeniglutamicibacter sulfureus TaxID=43666 RepID=A0ABU2BCP4_9MICC|nr:MULTISPECIES: helix-turn-helix domain-containing protein [Micrococcaceae]AXV46244.1 transposase IS3-family, IS150-group, OrfA [Arthrobacter sp.]MDO2933447.1 transposase [Paeniglutamicibacter sulfureus]MDO2934790.1 transposase [Paeniglutamicibacter sulfureus]MDO2935919.1 transposase [Paeniglutamicibacter sulfureus]MDR7356380.1 transposase-like protein [Paeniglutamicibacter sulfureus]
MRQNSSLTAEQRLAAVDLFEQGIGHKAVSSRLNAGEHAVRGLEKRFRIWGRAALESKPTNQVYSFEFKLAVVRQFLDGEATLMELAQRHRLSSPNLLRTWVRTYREQGEDGLRPKAKGRPKTASGAEAGGPTELEKLRRENQRLQAENAYLKKVRALRNQPPR